MTTVLKLWPGETFVCLGGGPSLTPDDVNYCRGKARVIAINDAYRLAQWADVLYACDAKWWKWHKGVPSFEGLKYSIDAKANGPHLKILKSSGADGLELQPTGLRTGRNSGYQAVNLAIHLGAAKIILLGYDMQRTGAKDHWFGAHPVSVTSPYLKFIQYFDKAAPLLKRMGIEVVNCTRRSALTCFPKQSLAQALPARLEIAS